MAITTTRKVDFKPSTTEIQIQNYNPAQFLPSDLEKDSSTISRTSIQETQEALLSIEEKRNTVKIVQANIGLTSDLVSAATDYRKLEGKVIDWQTEGIRNEQKLVKQETELVKLDTENSKLGIEREVLSQTQVRENAMKEITQLTSEEWELKKQGFRNKVEALRSAVEQSAGVYQESKRNLLGEASY